MKVRVRFAAGAGAALLLLSLTACGGSKGTAAASAPATSSGTTKAAVPATGATTTKKSSSSATGGTTGTKSCPGGDIPGVIGGKAKCLHAGQECSAKHAADYVQYGFACTQQGQKYVLTKK